MNEKRTPDSRSEDHMDLLAVRVESLLAAAVAYADASVVDRLPRLGNAICEIFESDGCVVAHTRIGPATREPITYITTVTSQFQFEKVQGIFARHCRANNPVTVVNSKADGGPALVTTAEIGHMLVYRLNSFRPFDDHEALLFRALWKSCGNLTPGNDGLTLKCRSKFPARLRQTLALLLDGLAEKEIARKLSISQHTVHGYVKKIYSRLQVSSRSQLLVLGLKAELALPGDPFAVRNDAPLSPVPSTSSHAQSAKSANTAPFSVAVGNGQSASVFVS